MTASVRPPPSDEQPIPGTRRLTTPGAVARIHDRLAATTARDFEAGAYLQAFLVAAVVAVLLTRLFLEMTGYPRLGSGGLHVAHLLWGGLLMLAALVLLLALVGRAAKRTAALVGGVGFGLFVDELGKFITADNDYLFQPAIALIYSLLVGLFLAFRAIERRTLSPEEALANAADMVRELILGGATQSEVARALALLERSGTQGRVADSLRAVIIDATRAPESSPSWPRRMAARAWQLYSALLAWRWFQRAVLTVFVIQACLGAALVLTTLLVVAAVLTLPTLTTSLPMLAGVSITQELVARPFGLWGTLAETASSAVSLACAIAGVLRLRTSRLAAYRWLERSVLVTIFFGQVLLFWEDQLAAVGQLAWNLLLLAALRYAIRQEDARRSLQLGLQRLEQPR